MEEFQLEELFFFNFKQYIFSFLEQGYTPLFHKTPKTKLFINSTSKEACSLFGTIFWKIN